MRGLFDGEHSFRIEVAGEGRVRFVHSERFLGVLVPLLGWLITATGRDFAAMNRALKARVEAAASAG